VAQDILQHDDLLTAYRTHWSKYDVGTRLIDTACHYLNMRLADERPDLRGAVAPVTSPRKVIKVRDPFRHNFCRMV